MKLKPKSNLESISSPFNGGNKLESVDIIDPDRAGRFVDGTSKQIAFYTM